MTEPKCVDGGIHLMEDCGCGDESCRRTYCVLCEYIDETGRAS